MADIEKVIKGLEWILEDDRFGFGENWTVRSEPKDDYEQAGHNITRAIELLKEQEAKHVIRKQCKKEHNDGSIDYFAEWYCPHCNMLILRGFDNPSIKFCYKCGKPILWEGR